MNYKNAFRFFISTAAIASAMSLVALTVNAQDNSEAKSSAAAEKSAKSSGRDPFKRYQPIIKPPKPPAAKLDPPSIQVRIERYRAQKAAAASAHVAAPKPTTALLLSEVQVTGIFRTPRGWSAMVEATPLSPKLSYVVYPGESFFDGQLVAIEEGRLVFRRDMVWSDGKREKSVEVKPLRAPSAVEAMTAAKSAPADNAGAQVKAEAKAEAAKPEAAKPAPEKQ
jgi:Tfp pilus assembly protein PilP